jgi:hypothetical protein
MSTLIIPPRDTAARTDESYQRSRTLTIISIGTKDQPASKKDVDNFRESYAGVVANGGNGFLITHHAWSQTILPLNDISESVNALSVGSDTYPATDDDLKSVDDDIQALLASDAYDLIYFTHLPITHSRIKVTEATMVSGA